MSICYKRAIRIKGHRALDQTTRLKDPYDHVDHLHDVCFSQDMSIT